MIHFSWAGTIVFAGWLFAMFCLTRITSANEYNARFWITLFYCGLGVVFVAAILGFARIIS